MKKAIAIIATLLALTSASAETYTTGFTVYDIDQSRNLVTFIDKNEELWCMYGTYGWRIGDEAITAMDDCNTQSIYDDKIVQIKMRE